MRSIFSRQGNKKGAFFTVLREDLLHFHNLCRKNCVFFSEKMKIFSMFLCPKKGYIFSLLHGGKTEIASSISRNFQIPNRNLGVFSCAVGNGEIWVPQNTFCIAKQGAVFHGRIRTRKELLEFSCHTAEAISLSVFACAKMERFQGLRRDFGAYGKDGVFERLGVGCFIYENQNAVLKPVFACLEGDFFF